MFKFVTVWGDEIWDRIQRSTIFIVALVLIILETILARRDE